MISYRPLPSTPINIFPNNKALPEFFVLRIYATAPFFAFAFLRQACCNNCKVIVASPLLFSLHDLRFPRCCLIFVCNGAWKKLQRDFGFCGTPNVIPNYIYVTVHKQLPDGLSDAGQFLIGTGSSDGRSLFGNKAMFSLWNMLFPIICPRHLHDCRRNHGDTLWRLWTEPARVGWQIEPSRPNRLGWYGTFHTLRFSWD